MSLTLINENCNKVSGIYCIMNIRNCRMYIGSSVNIKNRVKEHRSALLRQCHGNAYLQNDFNIHGIDSYIAFIWEIVEIKNLLKQEQHWLDYFYDGKKKCYNICSIAYSKRGVKSSPETRLKISLANQGVKNRFFGRKHTEETKNLLAEISRAHRHSLESKKKMSESRSGEKNHFYGKTHSEESRRKMSGVKLGSLNPWFGKRHTEETKAKMSLSAKLARARRKQKNV